MNVRSLIRRSVPWFARKAYINMRRRLGPPPLEEIVLHPYALQVDRSDALRLQLWSFELFASEAVLGGIATGIEIFFECGKRAAAELRIVLDDFGRSIDRVFVEKYARQAGVNPSSIAICSRNSEVQSIEVRRNDIFIAHNWWTALNLVPLIRRQHEVFGGQREPSRLFNSGLRARSTGFRRRICLRAPRSISRTGCGACSTAVSCTLISALKATALNASMCSSHGFPQQ